ncbi:MAG: peptidoglycan DD-metalloendopeptidase family protein [Sulfurimonas sp.]|nr:peptidoglycan DD-metalloendopeptidase family protein [Sulfurimonadaceae bacterium]
MKKLLTIILTFLPLTLFGATVENYRWDSGDTYLNFLEKKMLPLKPLYYDLDSEDKELSAEILSGVNYQILYDDNKKILQILIPLNDELQIHIYSKGDEYFYEAIPIISHTKTESLKLSIQNSPYQDILDTTGSTKLASIFITAFKKSINFARDIKKGDTLVMVYEQKYRNEVEFSMPTLQVAMIEVKGKRYSVYKGDDGKYYNEKGEINENFLLSMPISGARISSRFNKGRFHPILKKYRAHLGVDFAAPAGTPIKAAGDGRITLIGTQNGYGKVIKVQHSDGFLTLYAHQKSFKAGLKKGSFVRKGQVIGYVGSTGMSTGPHLHLGVYKNGVAVDPLTIIEVAKKAMSKKERDMFLKLKSTYDSKIDLAMQENITYQKPNNEERECFFNSK